MAWVVLVKAMFSCLNLKPDDEFLPYNMPELLNKTGHGLRNIAVAYATIKYLIHALPDLYIKG